jgi:hypothetical protein
MSSAPDQQPKFLGLVNINIDTAGPGNNNDDDIIDKATTFSYAKWKLVVIAVKSIGHACTSSFAVILSTYEPTGAGYAIWTLLIIVGMHLWFNVRLEHYVCPYKQRRIHVMGRGESEWAAVCHAREDNIA